MKMRIFKPATLLALLTLAVCAVAETAWAKNPKDIVYVFGDSLSDPGNLYALTGELFRPPTFTRSIPSPMVPYGQSTSQSNSRSGWRISPTVAPSPE
jgi:phospholipase/lecithinase/hemolysin